MGWLYPSVDQGGTRDAAFLDALKVAHAWGISRLDVDFLTQFTKNLW